MFDPSIPMVKMGDVVGGRYKLTRALATRRGGSLWGADDLEGGRSVVIMFRAAPLADHLRSLFERRVEAAQTAAPVGFEILERGVHDGVPYIVMQLGPRVPRPVNRAA